MYHSHKQEPTYQLTFYGEAKVKNKFVEEINNKQFDFYI